ncbi:MAG: ClbS/DfsB family four-helix bundle protein [Pseudomonadota bacterium]
MPAATNKSELLAATAAEFDKLERLLGPLDEASANWRVDDGDVSIKAVIAHRTHWLDLFGSWYEAGASGEDVQTPAPGYKWNQLKAYNAPIYQAAETASWRETHTAFLDAHTRFLARITALDETTLYTPKLFDWLNDWTLGRWAESAGPSHYRSAAKFVRAAKRANTKRPSS